MCVEDGIDSAGASGKLMISVLAAVAEIERENIQAQTMAGRWQKAKEGRWNGGFAPYGYVKYAYLVSANQGFLFSHVQTYIPPPDASKIASDTLTFEF